MSLAAEGEWQARLRELPAVDELMRAVGETGRPREVVLREARALLSECRQQILSRHVVTVDNLPDRLRSRLSALDRSSLRRVINATGVVLHTNLGRAPLPEFDPIFGYSNLEYDLSTGKRGKRDVHVSPLLEQLLKAPAITVNNNAAAVYLALHELAAGHEVIVSRGELIEIGDGFRIPDIMARSGAILREVGTTNRTRIEDYRDAITDRTRLLMRVHPSNFEIKGFTGKPTLEELTALGRERGVPVYEDLGSGCLVDLSRYGIREPLVQDSLQAGVDVVSFSTDKLLGGPQSGILAGRADLIQRLRRNPMYRAFRLDKLMIQSLAATLRLLVLHQEQDIPTLRMIGQSAASIRERAERFQAQWPEGQLEVVPGESVIGGGSTPTQTLPTWLLRWTVPDPVAVERALRAGDPPVVARIENDALLFDLRTISTDEEGRLLTILQSNKVAARPSTNFADRP